MNTKRRNSASWKAAKKYGDEAELAVAKLFKARDCEVAKTLGSDRFDLLVQMRVEVKHDLQAARTGNLAIEVRYRDRPSGIMDTVADHFVIVVGDTGYMAQTAHLLGLIESKNFPLVQAGDGGLTKVRLVPLELLCNLGFVQKLNLAETDD